MKTGTLDRLIEQCLTKLGALAHEMPPAVGQLADEGALSLENVESLKDAEIARYIDHTLLKPEVGWPAVEKICSEAREHRFASVCVNPDFVGRCRDALAGSPVGLATVVGFPLGATSIEVKAFEARQAVGHGATELDMVLNIGRLKDGQYDFVRNDVRAVVEVGRVPVKVILETGGLSNEEKVIACLLCRAAGASFVKTSTGFLFGGATVEDVALMRRVVGPRVGVKASGGIRDTAGARAMLAAGATRLGTSAALAIIGKQPSLTAKQGAY